MNSQLPGQSTRWLMYTACATLRCGARFTHRLVIAVGLSVIIVALALGLSPALRSVFMTQLTPVFNVGSARPEVERLMTNAHEQARITQDIAHRYRVARAPVGHLVNAAFDTGQEYDLDPLLLLAVMAIESRFNPYAESGKGAQGLMQVMAKFHLDKLDHFGGPAAALDPIANLKVGALILKECIARGGSLTQGLRLYVGALSSDNNRYSAKVLAERGRLHDVARRANTPQRNRT